mmetsp:Transcript_30382/g.49745  ORF Transcript_30382/g.49745 Transcript_30382/m.49745 type:complete len:84 (-) Transcript_30382:325-576(-)
MFLPSTATIGRCGAKSSCKSFCKSIFCMLEDILPTHADGEEDGEGDGSKDGEVVGLTLIEGVVVGMDDGKLVVDGTVLDVTVG